jgi:hypothetical protein
MGRQLKLFDDPQLAGVPEYSPQPAKSKSTLMLMRR